MRMAQTRLPAFTLLCLLCVFQGHDAHAESGWNLIVHDAFAVKVFHLVGSEEHVLDHGPTSSSWIATSRGPHFMLARSREHQPSVRPMQVRQSGVPSGSTVFGSRQSHAAAGCCDHPLVARYICASGQQSGEGSMPYHSHYALAKEWKKFVHFRSNFLPQRGLGCHPRKMEVMGVSLEGEEEAKWASSLFLLYWLRRCAWCFLSVFIVTRTLFLS